MDGLPREHGQSVAAGEVYRTRPVAASKRARGPVPCKFCGEAWKKFEERVPAVSFSHVEDKLIVECSCCGRMRTLPAPGVRP